MPLSWFSRAFQDDRGNLMDSLDVSILSEDKVETKDHELWVVSRPDQLLSDEALMRLATVALVE